MEKGLEWNSAPAVVDVAIAIAVADANVAANENTHKWRLLIAYFD
jgi:tellurite resistance protein